MHISAQIVATGSHLPTKIVTNNDLSKIVDTNNEWIVERTGIKQRHIAESNELTSDLAYQACLNLFKNAPIKISEVEMIIVATTSPDLTFPSTACILQSKLQATKAFAFDIQAVCSGFVYALSVANNFIKTGAVKNALVVGSETLSKIVDWSDRNTCVLFGDGAGAILLQSTHQENCGIIAESLHSDGTLNDILKTSGGPSLNQKTGFIEMSGREVFKHAVEKMANSVLSTLKKINLDTSDIDLLIPHQANLRILNSVAHKLNIPSEKIIITLQDHANTSAASIPLAFDFAFKNNRIKKGDLIVLEALGGGLTWGTLLIRY
ncbi:MAG: ketoacyl-ACP synthase III [Proteobacteria bacterium]|nr:ketoacyl-ACP synthase III [Pseudomonadota bacterium]NCA28929.1 ketoacyl-ACP synthase III [Pseudomonadota bacterium]